MKASNEQKTRTSPLSTSTTPPTTRQWRRSERVRTKKKKFLVRQFRYARALSLFFAAHNAAAAVVTATAAAAAAVIVVIISAVIEMSSCPRRSF